MPQLPPTPPGYATVCKHSHYCFVVKQNSVYAVCHLLFYFLTTAEKDYSPPGYLYFFSITMNGQLRMNWEVLIRESLNFTFGLLFFLLFLLRYSSKVVFLCRLVWSS